MSGSEVAAMIDQAFRGRAELGYQTSRALGAQAEENKVVVDCYQHLRSTYTNARNAENWRIQSLGNC